MRISVIDCSASEMLSASAPRSVSLKWLGRPVQPGEMHLQGGKILGGGLVQHLRDPAPFVVLRVHQPARKGARLTQQGVELLFGELAIGHVLDQPEQVPRRPITVRNNRGRRPHPDESPVFVPIPLFKLHLILGARHQLLYGLRATRDVCFVGDVPVGECLEFPVCVSHQILKRLIRFDKRSRRFREDDSDCGVLEDRSPALLARPKRRFRKSKFFELIPEGVIDRLAFADIREQAFDLPRRLVGYREIHRAARGTCFGRRRLDK